MKKIIPLVLCFLLIFSGCSKNPASTTDEGTSSGESVSGEAVQTDFEQTDDEMFTNRDLNSDYDESTAVKIVLDGTTASSTSDTVKISGSTVTITEEATYIVSGELTDGMLVVDAGENDKLQIVFNGVDITSSTSAPLYILEADKVVVTLAEGTENVLENGGTFTAIDDNNIDGAVFSKQDLTFNGTGSLTVTSPTGHGIVCKDDLVFTGGTYTVNCASHGLDANDSVRVQNSSLTVASGKDGIHAENSDDASLGFVYISSGTLNITAEGDGISSGSYMQIEGGTYNIVSGGGNGNGSNQSSSSWGDFMGGGMPGGDMGGGNRRPMSADTSATVSYMATTTVTDDSSTSMKGIKSGTGMLISDGTFTIDSADDSLHSNVSMTINGGTFEIASGDDGIHAEEELTVTNGTINITESYEGLEALDIKVSGGDITLVASDDGLNAAGGTDSSGITGGRDGMFGGGMMGGGMSSSSNGSIVISGGKLYINASGDGIDANGTLEITGGYTTVCGPTQGDTATLDYDISATITGGTFIGTGASGMAQTFSGSEQGIIAVSVGNQSANTEIVLKDSKGNTIVSYTPELSFGVVIISTPDMVSGETYEITVGSISGEFKAS